MLKIPIRSITQWPGKQTAEPKNSPFRAEYSQTLDLLDDELTKATAVDNSWIMELWLRPDDIRLDGQLRAGVRVEKPGIIFRFSRFNGKVKQRPDGSKYHEKQDISYPCDAFTSWKDNLRAVALSMQSLRRVERYGVFKYDEIISRLALPSADGKVSTRESAAAFIATHSGVDMKEILFSDTARAAAFRKAAQRLHPDRGGDINEFMKLSEANKALTTISQT